MAKNMYQKRVERKQNKANNTEVENKNNINWYPGHMSKTKRLIKEKLDLIDVVYEVVDSRIPYSSKIQDIDKIIKNKPKIMIMTKKDLCDMQETSKWVKYYQKKGYIVLLVDLKKDNLAALINQTKMAMKELNQKRISKGMSIKKTRVLIIGIPNVGKSTLINKLVGKKATVIGNKPGVTQNLSWIRINNDLELLDTPGILWPKIDNKIVGLNLASMSAIKEEILPTFDVATYILQTLNNYYPKKLKERYKIEKLDSDILVSMDIIAKNRGCILKKAEIDYDKVVKIIINELKNGYIRNITFDRYHNE